MAVPWKYPGTDDPAKVRALCPRCPQSYVADPSEAFLCISLLRGTLCDTHVTGPALRTP